MARWEPWEDDDRWGRYYPPSRPLAAKGGIKARSRRGAFAASWWGQRWITVLESLGMGARLSRGRSYARSGQVLNVEVTPGTVNANVQGSRPQPYKVTISLKTIGPAQRLTLGATLCADMSMVAKLVGGQLPPEIEQCFEIAGAPLFPQHSKDLLTSCSCPDWSNPCKHIAAVYYILAEEFDRDPFLLLTLRGIGRDEFMALLGAAAPQASEDEDEPAIVPPQPLSADPDRFWRPARLPDLSYGGSAMPEESAPMARRLGPFPMWRGEADFLDEIGRRSQAAAARAVEVLAGAGGGKISEQSADR